jgi:hypothetical protein
MTDIMIDLTSRPRKRYTVHRCLYCDSSRYPSGKIIDPTTDKAIQTDKGDYICCYCATERMLSLMGGTPNND